MRGGRRLGAGRPVGSKNKRSEEVRELLDSLGCEPITGMAQIAQISMNTGNYQLAGQMYKELAQYVYRKNNTKESHGEDTSELIAEMLQAARKRVGVIDISKY